MRDAGWVVPAPPRIPHPASRIPLMLNVALTGNIAAGKSTVVDLFRRWGATIIDADVLVREAQAPGGEVLAAIAGRFGADVLASDGTLDRAARSEEHTSELQSQSNLVCRLLLEKKKT